MTEILAVGQAVGYASKLRNEQATPKTHRSNHDWVEISSVQSARVDVEYVIEPCMVVCYSKAKYRAKLRLWLQFQPQPYCCVQMVPDNGLG